MPAAHSKAVCYGATKPQKCETTFCKTPTNPQNFGLNLGPLPEPLSQDRATTRLCIALP